MSRRRDGGQVFTDYQGRKIRLSAERRMHILEHPEMKGWMEEIGEVLANPERVVCSRSDPDAELFYVWKARTKIGPKYLCVVVVFKGRVAFILTAYLAAKIKKGDVLWPRGHP